MTQFKANGRVKKNVSSDLSPTMLDALLYGARCGFQGTVNTNRRTEDALLKRGLITCDHNVRDNVGDMWLYPVITAKGWAFLWETNKVARPADDGRLPIGSALIEANEWANANGSDWGIGERPTDDGRWTLEQCFSDDGWHTVGRQELAYLMDDDPKGRLTLEEALAFVPEADANGRVKQGFRSTSLGDAARLALMVVDHPEQIILTGYRVEITWKMSGTKSVGRVDRITDDSISWAIEDDRPGQSFTSVHRRVVNVRVLATRTEQEQPSRPSLERALELAYPEPELEEAVWADGITFGDLLGESREAATGKVSRKPTVISVSAKLARLGFGRYASILRNTVAHTGFKVRKGSRSGTVVVTWTPGSDFDHLADDRYRQEVERNRSYMAGLYAQALADAGYAVRNDGYTVTVSPS